MAGYERVRDTDVAERERKIVAGGKFDVIIATLTMSHAVSEDRVSHYSESWRRGKARCDWIEP